MVDKIEEALRDKTPVLHNPEIYVSTHTRFKTYLASIFSDSNKAQIYEMP